MSNYLPNDVASAFANVLNRDVMARLIELIASNAIEDPMMNYERSLVKSPLINHHSYFLL